MLPASGQCSETARAWLQLQAHLQLRPEMIDAYGRSLNDFVAFCSGQDVVPETLTREHIGPLRPGLDFPSQSAREQCALFRSQGWVSLTPRYSSA